MAILSVGPETSGRAKAYVFWKGGTQFTLAFLYLVFDSVRERAFKIAEGFHFNAASVPRIFWRSISPLDLGVIATLVHDFLYANAGHVIGLEEEEITYSRKEADAFFRELMIEEEIVAWRRELAYTAVRLFGGKRWKEAAARRLAGKSAYIPSAEGVTGV